MKKGTSIFLIVVFILTLISYASVLISPQDFRVSGFVSLSIPFFLILNLVLLIYYLARLSKKVFLPLVSLIVGINFVLITIPMVDNEKAGEAFSVLSYNIKWLVETEEGGGFDKALNWIASDDADIKCFQEFNPRRNIVDAIKKNGEFKSVVGGRGKTLAIFTNGRIINSGVLFFEDNINNVLFADIRINLDTVRVYNVHLESMGIKFNEMSSSEEVKEAYKNLKRRFVDGSVERAGQIKALLKHAEESKYPVIISGDFNDVPYSYNYFKLRANFNNAFEEVGKGLGFTFNGGLPFLRIDNQFYNSKLKVHKFKTSRDVFYSDHFPIKGSYSVYNNSN
jgi:endonuclease/exonuclease/phosphatase family metal-dependent hydrolase